MQRIFTIKQGNKTLSLPHRNSNYVIGFKTAITARKVYYSLDPNPKFTLVRDQDIFLSEELNEKGYDINLSIDVGATLFIPKCKGSILEPLNDGGYHLNQIPEKEFISYPLDNRLGIIMPYELIEESIEEFIFKACVVDPVI
jgi:hypothetical protein